MPVRRLTTVFSNPSGESSVLAVIAGHAAEVGAAAQAREEAEIAACRAAEAARHAAEEASARREAESNALEASWASWWGNYNASLAAGGSYEGEEEWEEWYEEEGEYEYATYHGSTQTEHNASFGPGVEVPEENEGQVKSGAGVVRLCTHELDSKEIPCAQYASILAKHGIGLRSTYTNLSPLLLQV